MTSAQQLTDAVIEAAEQLGLVRAEVGRILGYRCEQFSALYDGSNTLQPATHAWEQGELFVEFYKQLQQITGKDRAKMVHWFRKVHRELGNSPFYLIIDEGRLGEVVSFIRGL